MERLISFLQFKVIRNQIVQNIQTKQSKNKTNSSVPLNDIFDKISQNKLYFSSVLLSSINYVALTDDYMRNSTKICQNLNEITQTQILLSLLMEIEARKATIKSLDNEIFQGFNPELLDSIRLISLIFLSKIELDSENYVLLKKLTQALEIINKSLFSTEIKTENLNKLQILAFFTQNLLKIIEIIEISNPFFENALLELLRILLEKNRILHFFTINYRSNSSITDGINHFKFNAISNLSSNLVNLMLLILVKNTFLDKNLKKFIFKELLEWLNFLKYVLKKNKNFNSKKIVKIIMKRIFSCENDNFMLFCSIIFNNFNILNSNFAKFFKCKEKFEFGIIILKEILIYDTTATLELLMKESLFLDLFLKILIEFSKTNENPLKTNRKLKMFLVKLMKKLSKKANIFPFNVHPLIKRISSILLP